LSINPKFQAFEKFISGMYLGELVRQTLVALIDASPEPLLFSGHSSPVFNKQYGFDTSIMSAIEEAWIGQDSNPDAFVHPALGADFRKEDLSPKIVEKLERIRQIIVHQTGVKECFVSLRDALVSHLCILACPVDNDCGPDCSLGLLFGGSSICPSQWSSHFGCSNPTRLR
jgi:hexokinase